MPDPADPTSYRRRCLLAVTGLSPQIVTETLYALIVVIHPAFIPTHIEILTTEEGRQRAIAALLDPAGGAFRSFCRDYDLPGLTEALTVAHVMAMPDRYGAALADIRTAEDSAAAADAIMARVRALTEDTDSALHVSIAGGRKTMGFLAGHALSLFGRPQDRLSHVLVNDAFLTSPDFYYPPPQPRLMHDRSGRAVNTAQAGLVLADIPFLRLRDHLAPALRTDARSYMETISLAQAALDPVLEIDLRTSMVRCGGRTLRLPPAEFAWLAWMAARRRDPALPHGGALHWTEADPDEILRHYARVAPPRDVARMRAALKDGGLRAVFEQRTARVNKLVRDGLGPAAAPYALRSDRKRPRSRTGLTLDPERISTTI
jgi:CRISPR-associated protein (TIGR02584 family)